MVDQGDWLFNASDAGAEVLVDFTNPDVVMDHVHWAIDQGINMVVGTSGFSESRLERVRSWLAQTPRPGRVHRAELRARRRPDDGVRRPGGPVLRLGGDHRAAPPAQGGRAERYGAAHGVDHRGGPRGRRQGQDAGRDRRRGAGARGAEIEGVRVHSVRAAGLVAHQEVLFGASGETLTIRHDSYERASFMPGVLLAIRQVVNRPGLTVGLESLLDWP